MAGVGVGWGAGVVAGVVGRRREGPENKEESQGAGQRQAKR